MSTRFCGYEWSAHGSKQVAYVGNDLHIHEVYQNPGTTPNSADLTANTPGAAVSGSSAISGFNWAAGKSKHVVYTDDNGHIHELACTAAGWSHADLFDGKHIATANPMTAWVSGRICGYDWTAASTKQVTYLGNDLGIHELYMYPNQIAWATGMQGLTDGVLVQNVPLRAYDWVAGSIKQVVIAVSREGAQVGHLYWLWAPHGGKWSSMDLTAVANAPSAGWADAAGPAVGLGRGGHNCVVCFDWVQRIHLFFAGTAFPGWGHIDLEKFIPDGIGARGRSLSSCDWVTGGHRQIYFSTLENGHIHELSQPYNTSSGDWSHADLMVVRPDAPRLKDWGSDEAIVAYEWTAGGSKQVVYPSADHNLHELTCTIKDGWSYRQLTGGSNGPPPLYF